MFPNTHDALEGASAHDTLVSPVVFDKLSYSYNDVSHEVEASPGLFVQTLYILALELACHRIRPTAPSIKILVVGFTLAVLNQFQSFARRTLGTLCHEMCVSAGLTDADAVFDYDVFVSTGTLLFAAAFKSGGFDVDVTLLLATRSQYHHVAWQGHVVQKNLVYIGLTRAAYRVWLFIEDLRSEVLALKETADACGVTNIVAWRQKAKNRINRSTFSADEKRTQCVSTGHAHSYHGHVYSKTPSLFGAGLFQKHKH